MNKTAKIIIGLEALVIVFFMALANIQSTEAKKQNMIAVKTMAEARQYESELKKTKVTLAAQPKDVEECLQIAKAAEEAAAKAEIEAKKQTEKARKQVETAVARALEAQAKVAGYEEKLGILEQKINEQQAALQEKK